MRENPSRDSALPLEEASASSDTRPTGRPGPAPDGPLGEVLRTLAEAPEREDQWEEAERLAAVHQRPNDVADAYRRALRSELPQEVAVALGERAVAFLSEWFEEPAPLVEVLERVLEIDAAVPWAFDRLSVLFTTAERWSELLTLYDRVLPATTEGPRRVVLLQEAAHVAKDFAGDGDRAISYLEQLFAVRPADANVAASLERLLEREKRYEDLIRFWKTRVELLPAEPAQTLRARMAACWLDHLSDPAAALELCEPLLTDGTLAANASQLVERVLAYPSSSEEVRARAVASLKAHYEGQGRSDDVVRTLEVALGFSEGEKRLALHREIAALLRKLGKEAEAVEHYAALLVLEPASPKAKSKLKKAVEATGLFDRYAEALALAADGSDDSGRAITLLIEAADVRAEKLSDSIGAIELYKRVLDTQGAPTPTLLGVARKTRTLLAKEGRDAELLDVLERLEVLESDEDLRRTLLGDAAELADRLGDTPRALNAWRKRIDADAADREALDAVVRLLEQSASPEPLIRALRERAAAPVETEVQHADLVRVARIYADDLGAMNEAISAWMDVEKNFGQEPETVDALTELLAKEGRYRELGELLDRAVPKETNADRRVALLCRLGDVRREQLKIPTDALECYVAALDVDPLHAGVRNGLSLLLDEPSCLRGATDALALAYAVTDDWAGTISLAPHRLAVADGNEARTRILLETATLQERHAGDRSAALSSLRTALSLSPHDLALEKELMRLAEVTGEWSVAAEAYREAVLAAADPKRIAELLLRRGEILESHIADLEAALDAYLAILAAHPDHAEAAAAVVRVAARLGKWRVATTAAVGAAEVQGELPSGLLATMESIATEAGAWDAATSALASAITDAAELAQPLARDLEMLVAVWHRDRRRDPEAAERTLLAAHSRSGPSVETLRMLAALQRRAPGRPLVETLLQLAAEDGTLDPIHEAAEVSLGVLGDSALARSILERVLSEASTRWVSAAHSDLARLEWFASWALDQLVRAAISDRDYPRAIELLVEGAWLPFVKEKARGMIHQAAAIAANDLGDADRAIELYRVILERAPDDAPAIAKLGDLYERSERLEDLLSLRRHELDLAPPRDRRLTLRLDIADLLGRLNDAEGRVATLRENLVDEPGHSGSIGQLSRVLESAGRAGELADILTEQAVELERQGDSAASRDLWARTAEIAEDALHDIGRAIDAQRRAVTIAPTPRSLDALARLHSSRGEHALAVDWLEQRLAMARSADTSQEQVAPIVALLARAHLGAGNMDRARACLEEALGHDASTHELRDQLRELYRSGEAWEPLVDLLREGAALAPAPEVKLGYLREAGEILKARLERPEEAIPLLERAVELDPSERPTRMRLAEALRVTGRLDEAHALLVALVDDFGRRRPRERAEVHYQLALVADGRGDAPEATRQLELAAGMDVEHLGVFQMLGEVYKEAGELERAERAYRTLLLLALRHGSSDTALLPLFPSASAIFLELYRIAKTLNREERAAEVLESAFEAAGQSESEAVRFEEALRASGETALLLRSLEGRLQRTSDAAIRATILAELADVLDRTEGREAEALDARLDALAGAPESLSLHNAARTAALRAKSPERYADAISGLADQAANDGRSELAAELLTRLGDVVENDLSDPTRARDIYLRADATGAAGADVWRALERVCGAIGDTAGQARALRQLVFAGGDDLNGQRQNEQMYQLAELELRSIETLEQGVESLGCALDRDPQYDRALAMLRRAAAEMPGEHALAALYERVARASADGKAILDALTLASRLEGANAEPLREAVEIATGLGKKDDAEALLLRAVEISEADLGSVGWALVALAERREARGDLPGAVQWMRKAADVSEPADAFRLLLRVATLAAGPLADLPLAAKTYEALLERDVSDRTVWEPLLDVYRKMGDEALLEERLAAVADGLYDAEERSKLRMERAGILLRLPERADDAVAALRQILDEDPDHEEASRRLMDLCERTGQDEALVELLTRKLDAARERRDADAIVALSLRLGTLMKSRPKEALETVRSALEWVPESKEILDALLSMIGPEGDPTERADVLERLLALETGEPAAVRALALAKLRESLDDEAGAERAFEAGLSACPGHEKLRARLSRHYAKYERWGRLAEMRVHEATALSDPTASIALFREAAAIYRDRLGNAGAAARALHQALDKRPEDLVLVMECARCLAKAGEYELAAKDVTDALERQHAEASERSELLRLRAELRTAAGQDALALEDLEEAFSVTSTLTSWPVTPITPDLAAALERRRMAAAASGDRDGERAATLRLVELRSQAGDTDLARLLLHDWTQRVPDDAAALHSLVEIDTAKGRWESVAEAAGRLVWLESGAAKVAAALRLADACIHIGSPADARAALEAVLQEAPEQREVRDHLKRLYETIGAERELADLCVLEARAATDDETRFQEYRRAAALYLHSVGDAPAAIEHLEAARGIRPGDHDTIVLLADAYTVSGMLGEATALIDAAIGTHKGRRSRELAVLQQRMARVAAASGDRNLEAAWLNAALDSDGKNAEIACELADVATEVGQLDVALKALRAVSLLKSAPITRAMSYLRQGMIHYDQGDPKRAVLLVKRAQAEDATLTEAAAFLAKIGAK